MKPPSSHEEAVSLPSKLVYGSNNEHINSEKLLLQALQPNARVLTICGGADNYLSLLIDGNVASVVCVDMNPAQLALGQLKLILACSNLSTEDILVFLGMSSNPSSLKDGQRLRLYETVLEPQLPDQVAKFFRENLMYEIEHGVAQFGSEINSFRYFQRELMKLGFPPADLWKRKIDVTKFEQALCRDGVGTPEGLAEAAFLGESLPATYGKSWGQICLRFYKAFFQAVIDPNFENTFNKAIMIKGRYDMETLPEWITPLARERIRKRRHCVTFVNSPIDQVPSERKKFDLINTSNLFDWIDAQEGSKILTTLAQKVLSDNGCMLVRMAFTPAQDLVKFVPNVRPFDEVTPEQLAKVDYSHFWYNNPSGFAILARSSSKNGS